MRRILIGAALASLAISSAYAQSATVMNGTTCLKTIMVDRTKILDPMSMIFYMKDHTAWLNSFKNPCTTLPHNGYIYTPTPPDNICGDLQKIQVIQTHEVCQLGTFTPYSPEKPAE
jgi:hypothetical protein